MNFEEEVIIKKKVIHHEKLVMNQNKINLWLSKFLQINS